MNNPHLHSDTVLAPPCPTATMAVSLPHPAPWPCPVLAPISQQQLKYQCAIVTISSETRAIQSQSG